MRRRAATTEATHHSVRLLGVGETARRANHVLMVAASIEFNLGWAARPNERPYR
jgi:hypothetical protein